jgi:hypothetical protein
VCRAKYNRGDLLKPLFILAVAATGLSAQWLHIPTPGVPKTAGGQPNLLAPAPRTADGKPDLSGMWDIEHNRPCPAEGCNDMFIGQEFMDIGWSLKGGLPYQPWAADLVKSRMKANGMEDPSSHCLPFGPVKLLTTPLFRKILQLPGMIAILNEANASYRQIFTDGRALPSDLLPTFNGYSVGHWEGDTLVVETTGLHDGTWLDRNGSPMTGAARITERYHRVDFGHMQIDLTVDDPKAYTKPWTVRLNHTILLNTEMLDFYCLENEKDIPHLVK